MYGINFRITNESMHINELQNDTPNPRKCSGNSSAIKLYASDERPIVWKNTISDRPKIGAQMKAVTS